MQRVKRVVSGRHLAGIALSLVLLVVVLQLAFGSFLLPFGTKVDGEGFGGWQREALVEMLNKRYNDADVKIYLNDSPEVFVSTTTKSLGLKVDNTERVHGLEYPIGARLVPGSFFWWGLVGAVGPPKTRYNEYLLNTETAEIFGEKCQWAKQDAKVIKNSENELLLKKAKVGGKCDLWQVKGAFDQVEFVDGEGVVRVVAAEEQPEVTTEDAMRLLRNVVYYSYLNLPILDARERKLTTIEKATLRQWVSFELEDHVLVAKIAASDVQEFLQRQKITVAGKVINLDEMALRIAEYLMGKRQTVRLAAENENEVVEYERPSNAQIVDAPVEAQTEAPSPETTPPETN